MRRRDLLTALVLSSAAGCASFPQDPDDTLARVCRERRLRVGASPAEGWVAVGEGNKVSGPEADLATAFAEHLGARPEWMVDGEAGLVEKLELGELDLAIAGFTSDTKLSTRMGVTRAYVKWPDAKGKKKGHVMGVPLGENAFVAELERFLDSRPAEQKAPR